MSRHRQRSKRLRGILGRRWGLVIFGYRVTIRESVHREAKGDYAEWKAVRA